MSNYHYRLSDCWNEIGDITVLVERFRVLKETPSGYWVISRWLEHDMARKRWTPKVGARYCHATMQEAITHYGIRKHYEQKHLKARMMKNQTALANIENLNADILKSEDWQSFSCNRPFTL